MSAKLPKISFPVPSNKNGHAFSSAEALLSAIADESSGLYLVGRQGMWHGGIHITDATTPWCALSSDGPEERTYCREPYQGEQLIRCMADGEVVAWRVSKDYDRATPLPGGTGRYTNRPPLCWSGTTCSPAKRRRAVLSFTPCT